MSPIRPLNDRIVVKRFELPEVTTQAGIYLPRNARPKPQEGVVLAVGRGKVDKKGRRINPGVEVGDHVLFGKYAGMEVQFDGEELLIMREEEITGLIDFK